jgi:DNA-binding protein
MTSQEEAASQRSWDKEAIGLLFAAAIAFIEQAQNEPDAKARGGQLAAARDAVTFLRKRLCAAADE